MPLPAILAGLGSAAASPIGQQVIGAFLPSALSYGANKISNYFSGPQPMDPNVLAQQGYLQQIQQPINIPFAQQRQQLVNEYQQQIIPQLLERFTGAGGGRSNALGQQLGAAGTDLLTNLGALQEQNQLRQAELNQGRLGQLGGYLGTQQGLGLQAQELAQRGTIAQRNAALEGLGLMGRYNLGQQQLNQNRLGALQDIYQRNIASGLGQQYDTLRNPGRQAYGIDFLSGLGGAGAQLLGRR